MILFSRWLVAGSMAIASLAVMAQAPDAAPPKAAFCVGCHGEGGKSTQAQFPILAGQTSRYLFLQLRDYQEGRRVSDVMSPMAAGLTRDEMRELAGYFSKQKPLLQTFKANPEKSRLGKVKSDETLCTMCHLGGFVGQNEVPRVAGQHYDYVVQQLTDFKNKKRTNDAGTMTSVAGTLSDKDIENLAHYLTGL